MKSTNFQFGEDSFLISLSLSKLVPEGDPLRNSGFFQRMGEELVSVHDAASFDSAYRQVVKELPEPLALNMPAGFDRKLIKALCSDPDFLADWARRNNDFPL